jgi:protein involved in polysaccharide export with SLBB domain
MRYTLAALLLLAALPVLTLFSQEPSAASRQNQQGVTEFQDALKRLQGNAVGRQQDANGRSAPSSLPHTAQLALSNPDYRVTAGDVYTLSYLALDKPVVYTFTVDTSYRIRIANMGVINAAGRSFQQLKTEVEAIVSRNYPLTIVQFTLLEPAEFTVSIKGEVTTARELSAWALDRLSVLVAEQLTAYSSLRNVTIRSLSGAEKSYDLFQATRFGDLSENPYVRPGDVITVNRIERVVQISGAVERPGEYQILAGEELGRLIGYYANGFTPLADPSRIELVRYVDSVNDSGEKVYLGPADIRADYVLHNLDAVYVPSIQELLPVMFVEGAVRDLATGAGTSAAASGTNAGITAAAMNVSNRMPVRYNKGENYASLVQRNQGWFTSVSDTQNAYILRGGERIGINLNPMLYDMNYRSFYYVEEDDVLVIPFRQYFVTVAGSVGAPGRYPYIPDRTWEYYIALAGGFIQEQNRFETVVIKDLSGRRMGKEDVITPETTITASTNSFLYYFNQWSPVVITLFTIVNSVFTVMAVTGNL